MTRYKYLYLIWLLPLAFLFLGLHQTYVYFSISDTYQNGESYTAEVVEFEHKQIAAQNSTYIILRFENNRNNEVQKRLSLPVEMAGDLREIRVVPIRYNPGSFQEIVLMPAYETQRNLVWTNIAMAGLALLITLIIAVGVHRFATNKLRSEPEIIEYERID